MLFNGLLRFHPVTIRPMKGTYSLARRLGGVGLFILVAVVCRGQSLQHNLQFTVAPVYRAAPLTLNELSLTNAAGQEYSVTRLDFLVSEVGLRGTNGEWIVKTNQQAYINIVEGRRHFYVSEVPEGEYDRIRIKVGVRPELNHSNPAQYPADHPLNANLNGLHWTWASGYIFLAMEGHWRNGKERSGYSFHLGNDPQLMTIDLPLSISVKGSRNVELQFDVAKIFDGVTNVRLAPDESSTHSREGDTIAPRLKSNIEAAFRAKVSDTLAVVPVSKTNTSKPFQPLTPYRFTFSENFPIPDLPRDNPLSEEGVRLGRELFFDKQLSVNASQSCATCHEPAKSFTDAPKRFSIGAEGEKGTRNAMPIFNLAWKKTFFWDGRAGSLREQVLMPVQNPIEMHETLDRVVSKISNDRKYRPLFERTFGSSEVTSDRMARALEQFCLAQLSYNSKFDRALRGDGELTEEEKRGFQLFMTEYDPRREQFGADCFHCHGGPFFTTHGFANNGLDADLSDVGRFVVTRNDADKGKFSVPSLRNVELTAPYMHDGRFATLEQVVEHYVSGVKRNENLDPNLAKHPDNGVPLNDADKKALVAFLKTLTEQGNASGAAVSKQ